MNPIVCRFYISIRTHYKSYSRVCLFMAYSSEGESFCCHAMVDSHSIQTEHTKKIYKNQIHLNELFFLLFKTFCYFSFQPGWRVLITKLIKSTHHRSRYREKNRSFIHSCDSVSSCFSFLFLLKLLSRVNYRGLII